MPRFLRRMAFLMGASAGRKRIYVGIVRALTPLLLRSARLWRRTGARRTRLVAVTGSFGKTTTTRALIRAFNLPLSRYVDMNALPFVALAILRLKPWQKRAVLELGVSGPGQMRPLIRTVRPDVTVVMSIGSEHIQSFKTLETTAREKALAVAALPPDGLAVLNADDPRVAAMAREVPCRVVTFGIDAECDARARQISLDWPNGVRFDLVWRHETREVFIPLLGRPGVYAALAALATALSEGEPFDAVVERLRDVKPKANRLRPVLLDSGAYLLRDDYKGPLESFAVAFETLAQAPARRRLILIAEPTESNSNDELRAIGAQAARVADLLLIYGSDKSTQTIRSGARRAGMTLEAAIRMRRDIPGCIAYLQQTLGPGDVLLIKNRYDYRLGRVALALMGWQVRCHIPQCSLRYVGCENCSMLARGWRGLEGVADGPAALETRKGR